MNRRTDTYVNKYKLKQISLYVTFYTLIITYINIQFVIETFIYLPLVSAALVLCINWISDDVIFTNTDRYFSPFSDIWSKWSIILSKMKIIGSWSCKQHETSADCFSFRLWRQTCDFTARLQPALDEQGRFWPLIKLVSRGIMGLWLSINTSALQLLPSESHTHPSVSRLGVKLHRL